MLKQGRKIMGKTKIDNAARACGMRSSGEELKEGQDKPLLRYLLEQQKEAWIFDIGNICKDYGNSVWHAVPRWGGGSLRAFRRPRFIYNWRVGLLVSFKSIDNIFGPVTNACSFRLIYVWNLTTTLTLWRVSSMEVILNIANWRTMMIALIFDSYNYEMMNNR